MSIISHFLKKIHIEVAISSRVAEIVVVGSGFFTEIDDFVSILQIVNRRLA